MQEWFRKMSVQIAEMAGSAQAFAGAFLLIAIWLLSGPLFHYRDTWQLVINTATTIITFLMVFLIQNTQNRDTKAMQLKLDELIRVQGDARNALIDLEELSDDDLKLLAKEFAELREKDATLHKGLKVAESLLDQYSKKDRNK